MPSKKVLRVAVKLTSDGYNRGIQAGIAKFAWENNWVLTPGENAPDYIRMCGLDAVIGQFSSNDDLSRYLELNIPLVITIGRAHQSAVPRVFVDHESCGRLAAEHFLDRGFTNFAFLGYIAEHSTLRQQAFANAVQGPNRSFVPCPFPHSDVPSEAAKVVKWLHGLKKPVALFTADDRVGMGIINLCHVEGIHVPAKVAVVGVNDDWICGLTRPELSSVAIPWEDIGYKAAWVIARLINRQPLEAYDFPMHPTGVSVRGSSDISALADREVSEAAAFIRAHFHEHIGVEDILNAVPIGRRPLERRFKALVGRTLLDEIHRVRLERASRLLLEGNLRVSDIAHATGFGTRAQFHRVFLAAKGMTPHEYRSRQGLSRAADHLPDDEASDDNNVT